MVARSIRGLDELTTVLPDRLLLDCFGIFSTTKTCFECSFNDDAGLI
uniref:Uncharacterized protein n=1 Tax=Anopheles quadriannulatus TaxID=34691 RepID=A0A182XS04_ANOQN